MKTAPQCPDLSLLSQFLDHELAAEEQQAMSRHLETCPQCLSHVKHLGRAADLERVALRRALTPAPSRTLSRDCVSPERVAAYVHKVLPTEELGKIEQHLQTCNGCLAEVMEAWKIAATLDAVQQEPVPVALKNQVASRWKKPSNVAPAASLSRLVIQLVQRGLRLVEQHLVEPLLDVQTMMSPMPAYRTGEEPTVLNLKLSAEQATIAISAAPDGKGLALRLALVGAKGETLAGQRIFLRQNGKSIFSARTDGEGVIRVPHIEFGLYEISCAGLQTTFQLELRA